MQRDWLASTGYLETGRWTQLADMLVQDTSFLTGTGFWLVEIVTGWMGDDGCWLMTGRRRWLPDRWRILTDWLGKEDGWLINGHLLVGW